MAIVFDYRPTGIETTSDGARIPYVLTGENNEQTVRLYVKANTPKLFGTFYRKEIRLTHIAIACWNVDVEYATFDKKEKELNDVRWSFDTTGKTKHVTQGLCHVATYSSPGRTAIDHKGAIGVTDDSVEGVDVTDKAYKWTEVWQLPKDAYNFAYSTILGELTGCMNASYFRGFPAYTVQFGGSTGGALSGDGTLREFNYSFEVSPSEYDLSVGDITGINKIGWDYASVRYESSDDQDAKKTTPKPLQVDVDRVLRYINFSILGIGSGVLS